MGLRQDADHRAILQHVGACQDIVFAWKIEVSRAKWEDQGGTYRSSWSSTRFRCSPPDRSAAKEYSNPVRSWQRRFSSQTPWWAKCLRTAGEMREFSSFNNPHTGTLEVIYDVRAFHKHQLQGDQTQQVRRGITFFSGAGDSGSWDFSAKGAVKTT
jgi:hypothetical protein